VIPLCPGRKIPPPAIFLYKSQQHLRLKTLPKKRSPIFINKSIRDISGKNDPRFFLGKTHPDFSGKIDQRFFI
jgi:hypothetical protein